jgi:hypothetical protein
MRWTIVIFTLIGGLIAMTCLKALSNTLSDKGFHSDSACASIAEAKAKGVFVCNVQIDPMNLQLNGSPVELESGWIEKQVKTRPVDVWWTQTLPRFDYYLCLRVHTGADLFRTGTFFVRQGQEHGFMGHDNASFDDDLSECGVRQGEATLYIASEWKSPRTNPIRLSWEAGH